MKKTVAAKKPIKKAPVKKSKSKAAPAADIAVIAPIKTPEAPAIKILPVKKISTVATAPLANALDAKILPALQNIVDGAEKSKIAFQARMAKVNEFRKKLCADFPNVFDPRNPKPLAIGIHTEIFARYPEYSHLIIRQVLRRWTHQPAYLKNLQTIKERITLMGRASIL